MTGDMERVRPDGLPLTPMPYLFDLIAYLKVHEAALWAWFSADQMRSENNAAVRLELLKATYRLERGSHAELYAAFDDVAAALHIEAELLCYQSSDSGDMNASMLYVPGEAHIVFTGPVLTALNSAELRWLLAHELAHFTMLDNWRDYATASGLLAALAHDLQAQAVHHASLRLLQLYTEAYCDRVALNVTNDLDAGVTALVRLNGGGTVTSESYLRQTADIFASGEQRTAGRTHPENFVRARALQLWLEDALTADAQLAHIIQGSPSIDDLDVIAQQRLGSITRRLVVQFLQPHWLQTDALLAHARRFFDDLSVGASLEGDLDLDAGAEDVRDYFAYVILDFATADRELEDAGLAAALLFADRYGLGERFRRIAMKELNLRKKQLGELENDAAAIVARAESAA